VGARGGIGWQARRSASGLSQMKVSKQKKTQKTMGYPQTYLLTGKTVGKQGRRLKGDLENERLGIKRGANCSNECGGIGSYSGLKRHRILGR